MSSLVNRNVTTSARRTSMRLEPEIWDALDEICTRERTNVAGLVQTLDSRARPGGRTSAVRVHVLTYFRSAATEAGHAAAGHGALPKTQRHG
jgi:predicted DNA-binding ribbon-helix-helix protein